MDLFLGAAAEAPKCVPGPGDLRDTGRIEEIGNFIRENAALRKEDIGK